MTHPVTYQTVADDDERMRGYYDETAENVPLPHQIDAMAAEFKAAGILKAPSQPKKQYAERVPGRKHKKKSNA
jgi:hypothetical protein